MSSIAAAQPSTVEGPLPVRAGSVIIGLLVGRMQHHHLTKFTPQLTLLPVTRGGDCPGQVKIDSLLPIDTVSFIAFLKLPDDPPAPAERTSVVRVHVSNGRSFKVRRMAAVVEQSCGFYALPDGQSPFKELFFYDHGVNRIESSELLGDLLVQEGVADAQAVQRGLSAQSPQLGQILIEQRAVEPRTIELATADPAPRRLRLGEVLIDAGLATAGDVERALDEQKRRKGKRLGALLVEMKIVSEVDLAAVLAKKFGLPFVDLDRYPIDLEAAREIPPHLIERYGFLPISRDADSLTVAIFDPLFTEITDVLRFHLKGKRVREVVATESQLRRHVDAWQAQKSSDPIAVAGASQLGEILIKLERDAAPTPTLVVEDTAPATLKESDSGIIQLANQIILDAHRQGASDIHVEPNGAEENVVVRFRIDGECVTYVELPSVNRNAIVARFKIMAELDISERRKPQDGKIRMKLGPQQHLELRVATLPTTNGNEDLVLRLLAASKPPALDGMGFSERNLQALRAVVAKPYGLFLCVGPTGSGKTTTLHSVLASLNQPDTKIWTAEDPVEITQKGLRQMQMQPKVGLTFAAALRAFLRADPDVIMVGEMRDTETGEIAVQAALTGHLVLSTLHTNSAPETITRLLDMGLDPFSFSDALLGTLAQRLARALCPSCKKPRPRGAGDWQELVNACGQETLERLGLSPGPAIELWHAPGCDACGQSGYRGRIALHELLIMDNAVRAAVQRRAPAEELRQLARETGMTTLLEDGVTKALGGLTDLRQVLAVCSR